MELRHRNINPLIGLSLAWAAGGRMTGMRSWMWATASFALVVRMAKLTF
jgi:hypothetical protein